MTHKSSSSKKQLSWRNANVLASSWKETSSFAECTKLDMLSILDDLALLCRNINRINNQNVWCLTTFYGSLRTIVLLNSNSLDGLRLFILYKVRLFQFSSSKFIFWKKECKVFSLATDFFFGHPPSLLAFTTFFLKSHVPKDDQKGFSPLAWDAVCNI